MNVLYANQTKTQYRHCLLVEPFGVTYMCVHVYLVHSLRTVIAEDSDWTEVAITGGSGGFTTAGHYTCTCTI